MARIESYPLLEQVHEVGRRARRLLWIRGLLTVLAVMALLIPVAVLLDYGLQSETIGLRWLLSSVVAVSFIAACVGVLLPILRTDTHEVQVARWIERGLPTLKDRLSSAVEFLHRSQDDPTAGSSDLRAALVQEVSAELRSLNLLQVLETRSVRRTAIIAISTFLVVGAMVTWIPIDWRVGVSRVAFPWNPVRWPTVHSLAFDALPTQVAQGGRLPVRVIDKHGKLPTKIELWYWPEDRTSDQADRYEMKIRDQGAEWILPRAKQSFRIRAVGGDHRDMDWVRVAVVEAPRITDLQISVYSPAYTQWPPQHVSPNFEALEGSRIGLRATTHRSLRSAHALWQDEDGAENSLPLTITGDGTSVSLDEQHAPTWTITTTTQFRFELVDRRGLTAILPGGSVTAIHDQEPSIALRQPDETLPIGPRTTVPVQAEITDDLTLQTVRLIYTCSNRSLGEETAVVLYERQEAPRRHDESLRGPDVLPLTIEWNLAGISELEPGMEISWYLQAEDIQGQKAATERFQWTVQSDHDLDLYFARQEQQLLSRIEKTRGAQQAAAAVLQQILSSQADSPSPPEGRSEELQTLSLAQRNVHELLTDSPTSILHDMRHQWEMIQHSGIEVRAQDRRHREWISRLQQLDADVLVKLDALLRRCVQTASADRAQEPDKDLVTLLGQSGKLQSESIQQLDEILSEVQRQDFVQHLTQQAAELKDEQRGLLRDTMDLLEETIARPLESIPAPLRDALRAVKDRQMELARKTEQFLTRLDNLPPDTDPVVAARFSTSRRLAGEAGITQLMRRAAEELEQTRVANATEQQKEAETILQQVADLLTGVASAAPPKPGEEANDHETASMDIFLQQLQLLEEKQTDLCHATVAVGEQTPQVANGEMHPVTRSLADQQAALAVETRSLPGQLIRRKVMSWLLRQTAAEMDHVAERLREGDIGQTTLSIQQNACERLGRLTQLLAPLRDQGSSPAEEVTPLEQGPSTPGEEGALPTQLPRMEIQLLLELQQELNQSVIALRGQISPETPPDSPTMRDLEDLARRQGALADLLDELIGLPDRSSQDAPR